ncbi:Co2+/Mg2+ efflux protein ApaG [Sphingomicrobium lutaoense]|uniref:Protein ApaG n=1 Tax=Sphingomicrobium lutaoense TaxID=515949 RepID=A0A839Z1B6_9SPHN|nr:Co2+/Mg2+ efflux protein ApaG [Sphingomicrobium lutaoense]MBB3763493.1 ApaG protein [Sphingomicrobium lutaoense]
MTATKALDMLFGHSATTGDITVRVAVNYLAEQSAPGEDRWFWSYHIRIENKGKGPVQLLGRRWLILDGRGIASEVIGEGVVGDMPVIAPGSSYDYVSGCPLATPTGSMEGSYQMVAENGDAFEVEIPKFPLQGPAV